MANLQIKGIKDDLYAQIKNLAASENRSVSQQVLFLIKEHISKKKNNRKAGDIVKEIKHARKNSKKLKQGF